MRATIVHESRGRMRLRLRQKTMTLRQADLLEAWLKGQPWAREAAVHERTGCVIVTYTGERETVLAAIGRLHLGRGGGDGHPARPQHPGAEPGVSGEAGGQGADEGGGRPVSARPPAGGPGGVAHGALPPQGPAVPGPAADQGGAAGRPVHRHLRGPPGLRHRRHGDVPAGDRRAAGGLDAEEVRGRPGGEPVPPRGPGVAENRGRGGAGPHRPGKARRPGAGPGRGRHPPGRRGGGGGGHRQPGLPHRRVRPRGQAARRRGLRRHRGGGGRVRPGGDARPPARAATTRSWR